MKPSDFNELNWVPLVIGMLGELTHTHAYIRELRAAIDKVIVSVNICGFSLWSFWYKLQLYGSNLDPRASVQVEPFMPPMLGYKLVGQFDVWSYPAAGAYMFLLFGLFLAGGLWLTWRETAEASPAG